MRFSYIAAVLFAAAVSCVTAQSPCTTNFVGTPDELQAAQQTAIASFGNLFLVQKNIQRGFDLHIPGDYINHNPFATSGRQNALNILVPALASPSLTFTNVHWFAGQGYGILHYRMRNGATSTGSISSASSGRASSSTGTSGRASPAANRTPSHFSKS